MSATDYQSYLKRFLSDTFYPQFYSVVVTSPGVLSAPANGFIDDLDISGYAVPTADPTANPRATGNFPTTLLLSEAKVRGNMRWEEILIRSSATIQPTRQFNVSALADATTPADEDTEATLMEFVFQYDRPEYLATDDEDNPGTTLVGADAVQRFVARALVVDLISNRLVYNPDNVANPSGTQIQGPIIEAITAEKLFADVATAESNIVVTLETAVSDTAL